MHQDAIDLLQQEFGNPEKLIDAYIQKLLALQPVKNKGDIAGLRKLYNTTTTITRSFQTLGIKPNQYGMMLKSVILKVIPFSLRIEFKKQVLFKERVNSNLVVDDHLEDGSESSGMSYEEQIAKVLAFLKVEVDSVEQAQHVYSENDKFKSGFTTGKRYGDKQYQSSSERHFTTAELFSGTQEKCVFCSGNHESANCKSRMTLNERKAILKNKNRCFRCTKANHSSINCRTGNLKCSVCKKRHATSMCDPTYLRRSDKPRTFPINKNKNEEVADQTTMSNSSSLFTNENVNTVYLQTATAIITNCDSNKAKIKLIFDGGSQTTFNKESVSREMNLQVIDTIESL